MIEHCLIKDPDSRPSPEELLVCNAEVSDFVGKQNY